MNFLSINILLVRAQAEAEVFKMVTSGKRGKKAWKRMVSYPLVYPQPRLRGLNDLG